MSVLKNNLAFEYLHRDNGNYKQFGRLVFNNPNQIDVTVATLKIKEKLIDKMFFYPSKVGVREFNKVDFAFNMEWYEFVKFSTTNEKPTEVINIENFIELFNTK
ncbi:hypothetical protein BWZ20_08410 [Winogradskyella sp. J14-2]|uniref:hypothetical protein n=1 Tax=Winogradskyella sp. J14-2 TaxID=1936080 RepID=UPI0009726BFF|nr:hypothetical protein [Winogradskyella sp. J14-2]APY08319.1 hypothetical protein BWZ20_08410 [Winogradskyella sp. J14-2]